MVKIVCINNIELTRDSNGKSRSWTLPLTRGQIYDADLASVPGATKEGVRFYFLMNNEGEMAIYPAHYFITIDVWREIQLNKII